MIVLLLLADLALPTQLAIPADFQSLFPSSVTSWHIEWSRGGGRRCIDAIAKVASQKAAFDDLRPRLKQLGFSVAEPRPGVLLGEGPRGSFSAVWDEGTILYGGCPEPRRGPEDVLAASPLGKAVGELIRDLGLRVTFAIYGQLEAAKPDLQVHCDAPAGREATENALRARKFVVHGGLWRRGDLTILFSDKGIAIYGVR